MKVLDYFIIALVAAWFIAAVVIIVRNWRRGKHGCCKESDCSGQCSACAMNCNKNKEKN